jgi:sterol desaturase/sphingolipid hydroxylase (fatty acid hydroxylase superfamily)
VNIGRELVRLGFLPLMLLGFNGVGVWLAASGAPKLEVVGLLLIAVAVAFVAERVVPYELSWNVPRRDRARDVAHAVVNEAIEVGSLMVLPALVGWVAINDAWPSRLPFVVQVLGAVLVVDFGITIGHWMSHRSPVLWRFHAVHHSVKRFYGFNGLMKHPLHQNCSRSRSARRRWSSSACPHGSRPR